MNISNVPVGCHICGNGMAYGRESSYRQGDKMIVECVWVCAKCNGVAKRHEEQIKLNNESKEEQ